MPHLITAHKGEDHVESYNDRHYNAALVGNNSYAFKGRGNFACSMVDSNTLRIMSGDAQCCGAHWSIDPDYEDYTIENGTPGYKRIDLAVAHIETAPQEKMDIRILKGEETTGTPVTPSYIQGDLNAGDTVVEQPICSVTLDGINPGTPEMLMNFIVPYEELCDSLSQREDAFSVSVDLPANAVSDHTVNFRHTFPELPNIFLQLAGTAYNKDITYSVTKRSTTDFQMTVRNDRSVQMHAQFFVLAKCQ